MCSSSLSCSAPQIIARETESQPASERRTGTATVTISVVNANDHEPEFAFEEYTFYVTEEQGMMELSTTSPVVLSAVKVSLPVHRLHSWSVVSSVSWLCVYLYSGYRH